MSDISYVVVRLSNAASNSSGRERKFYHALQDALTEQNHSKLQRAKELYQSLGYSAQGRADTYLDYVAEYL